MSFSAKRDAGEEQVPGGGLVWTDSATEGGAESIKPPRLACRRMDDQHSTPSSRLSPTCDNGDDGDDAYAQAAAAAERLGGSTTSTVTNAALLCLRACLCRAGRTAYPLKLS